MSSNYISESISLVRNLKKAANGDKLAAYCATGNAVKVVQKLAKVDNSWGQAARGVVDSFTKGTRSTVSVDKRFLKPGDKCLIVDDFLAEGNASLGLIDLCNQAGAEVVGVAIVIEKGFQNGRKRLEQLGVHVESAAIVDHFENGKVVLR